MSGSFSSKYCSTMKKHCPSCSKLYCSTGNQSKICTPLLLPCGHNCCADCIKEKIIKYEAVKCEVCNNETIFSKSVMLLKQSLLYEKFPIDYKSFDKMCANIAIKATGKTINENYYINLKALMVYEDKIGHCNECQANTTKKCEQCNILLCYSCFVKIHGFVQSFKHHIHKTIENVEAAICPSHNKQLDYYCKECSEPRCFDCAFLGGEKNCKIHTITPIREMNLDIKRELESLIPTLDETLRRLSATAIENAKLLYKVDEDIHSSNIVKKAENYFNQLHEAIQKKKLDFMNHIEEQQKMQKDALLKCKNEIADHFKTINNVLNEADIVIKEDNNSKINLLHVVESAKKAVNTPWFLKKPKDNNATELFMNYDIFNIIEQCIHNTINTTYQLLPSKDIAEGVTIPPAPDAIIFPPEITTAVPREVKTVHLTPGPSSNVPMSIQDIYKFAPSSMGQWSTSSSESTDRSTGANIKPLHIGCKEVVKISYIEDPHNFYVKRLHHSNICNQPMLPVLCKLANCKPIDRSWKYEDTVLMKKIVNNNNVVIMVRFKIMEPRVIFECDVVTCDDDVSLAHALAFHGRALLIKRNVAQPTLLPFEEKPKLISSKLNDTLDSTCQVYITHVTNPDKLYVREVHLMEPFYELCSAMDEAYKYEKVSLGAVHCPTKGMVCAVNLVDDRGYSWVRGEIRALLQEQRVSVFVPDTGEVLDVHCSDLRRINKQFLKYKALSIECHLSGVAATKKLWSQEATELVKSYCDSVLKLKVDKYDQNSIGVILYIESEKHDTSLSINNELVEKNLAFNPQNIRMPVVSRKTESYNVLKVKKETDKKMNDKKENKSSIETGPLKIRILSCESPSLIYVSLLDQEEAMLELNEKLQNHFARKQSICNRQWQVGDTCCGYCSETQCWCRAVITELAAPQVKLFFTDYAIIETVSYREIYELPNKFAQLKNAAILCHMNDIVPSVEGDWPSVTKEYLITLIKAYDTFFINKYGNMRNTHKKLSIELWARESDGTELCCLNHKIVEQGLAIPDKSMKKRNNTLKDFLNIADMNNERFVGPIIKSSETRT